MTDIDVDVPYPDQVKQLFPELTPAIKINKDGTISNHPGVYLTDIPTNPVTGMASIDYNEANNRGYFKLDILPLSFYQSVRSNQHLADLMHREPNWDMLLDRNISSRLFHVHDHPRILETLRPRSIEELAIAIAIKMPGKAYLQNQSMDVIRREIWRKPKGNGAWFKKSHAISYALVLAAQMNILQDQINERNQTECSDSASSLAS